MDACTFKWERAFACPLSYSHDYFPNLARRHQARGKRFHSNPLIIPQRFCSLDFLCEQADKRADKCADARSGRRGRFGRRGRAGRTRGCAAGGWRPSGRAGGRAGRRAVGRTGERTEWCAVERLFCLLTCLSRRMQYLPCIQGVYNQCSLDCVQGRRAWHYVFHIAQVARNPNNTMMLHARLLFRSP